MATRKESEEDAPVDAGPTPRSRTLDLDELKHLWEQIAASEPHWMRELRAARRDGHPYTLRETLSVETFVIIGCDVYLHPKLLAQIRDWLQPREVGATFPLSREELAALIAWHSADLPRSP